MTDPPRLRADPRAASALREELARLARTEMPDAARVRIARALGVTPAGAALPLALKAGIGLVVVGGAAALWALAQPAPVAPRPPMAPMPAESATVEAVLERPTESAGVVQAPLPPPPPPTTPTPVVTATVPPLANEATLFREAGAALHSGDPQGALRIIDELARRFPHGTFAQERDVLRIDALMAAGRASEARDLARAFVAQHPESAHRARLEGMFHN
jgi:Outer membrane lipoprotein